MERTVLSRISYGKIGELFLPDEMRRKESWEPNLPVTLGLTVHGFRSTFKGSAAECTAFPRLVAEAALAHTIEDKTEAAYLQSDFLEQRRRLMDHWADFCDQSVSSVQFVPIKVAS